MQDKTFRQLTNQLWLDIEGTYAPSTASCVMPSNLGDHDVIDPCSYDSCDSERYVDSFEERNLDQAYKKIRRCKNAKRKYC